MVILTNHHWEQTWDKYETLSMSHGHEYTLLLYLRSHIDCGFKVEKLCNTNKVSITSLRCLKGIVSLLYIAT